MQENQLLTFLLSRPFEPFVATLVGGREIVVQHPEFVTPSRAGLGLWIFHESGHVEAIDSGLVLSLKTVDPVDPVTFIG
jgi:hypothetical protein